jgi:hypothetical protein
MVREGSKDKADRNALSEVAEKDSEQRPHNELGTVTAPNAARISTARKDDILFGRGTGYQCHPGNKRMREIVDWYRGEYHSLHRGNKHILIKIVYDELIEGGVRFLKRVDGEDAWVKADVDVAMQKVSHALRYKKSRPKQLAESDKNPSTATIDNRTRDNRSRTAPSDLATRLPVNPFGVPSSYAALASREPLIHGLGRQCTIHTHPLLNGLAHNRALNPGLFHASYPTNDLEALCLAALDTYSPPTRIPNIPSLIPAAMLNSTNIEFYNRMRRDQLLREMLVSKQLRDAFPFSPTSTHATIPSSSKTLNTSSEDETKSLSSRSLNSASSNEPKLLPS